MKNGRRAGLIFAGTALVGLALICVSCKGKTGDTGAVGLTGPQGPGSFTEYSGTITSDPQTISIPAVTASSIVEVAISSQTGLWQGWTPNNVDTTNKTFLLVSFSFVTPAMIGGNYHVIVENP
jgi:hypothetical protein